ncbi:MAG TPA: hypothetical protein PLI97_11885 [Fluviicola sp.]|nr:hypothetical protein [Fluviicola sp.]
MMKKTIKITRKQRRKNKEIPNNVYVNLRALYEFGCFITREKEIIENTMKHIKNTPAQIVEI